MPTYEYGCSACGSQWEEVQRITAPPLEVCPKCGKSTAQRLISAGAGFILKGGGWYSDLYSSAKPAANKTESNGATSPDAASKGKDSATKSEGTSAKTETTAAKAEPASSSSSTPSSTSS
jgi:putative FmdB family regulatory protein